VIGSDIDALDPTARLVALVLSTFMNSAGEAWPAKTTIGRCAGLRSTRAVDRAVLRLQAAELLTVTRSRGRKSNRYAAVTPAHAREQPSSSLSKHSPARGDGVGRRQMQGSMSSDTGLDNRTPHGGAGFNPVPAYMVDGDKLEVWLNRFGVHFAHDRDDFREECCRANPSISADEAEALRLQLLERGAL
jgi:hypothetical protein